jgi:hypothetical protein
MEATALFELFLRNVAYRLKQVAVRNGSTVSAQHPTETRQTCCTRMLRNELWTRGYRYCWRELAIEHGEVSGTDCFLVLAVRRRFAGTNGLMGMDDVRAGADDNDRKQVGYFCRFPDALFVVFIYDSLPVLWFVLFVSSSLLVSGILLLPLFQPSIKVTT